MYLFIVLVVAASALGCVGNKETGKLDTSTQVPASPALTPQPAPHAANTQVTAFPAQTTSGTAPDDPFGTESELTSVDSLVNDLNADITFSDSI